MTPADAARDRAIARKRREEAVARAYGCTPAQVELWSERTLAVFERKARDLGLHGFTTPTPTCEVTDESEVLPF